MDTYFKSIEDEDLDAIVAIEQDSHIHPWSKSVFRDCLRVSYICDVLMSGDSIVVYGVMSIAAGEAHVFNVCVSGEFRRQGYGEEMMQHLLEIARNKKAETAFLEVRPSNEVAISLYEKLGFVVVGRRKNYYPADQGREDAVIMKMSLLA